jgi:transposase
MMRPGAEVAVYLCVEPVDMRKQAASLALLVEQSLKHDVFAPALYVFSNRRHDRVRIVYWERNGLVLWSKRLEGRDRFIWPQASSAATVSMTGRELNRLLDGFDVFDRGHRELAIRRVG